MLRLAVLYLFLIAPLAVRAAPVEIALSGFGVACNGGFGCSTGVHALSMGGNLIADLGADTRLTNIYGELTFEVLGTGRSGSLGVVAGTLDLDGDGDRGSIKSFFKLAGGSTLWFPDRQILGPANSFDGTHLYLAGSTWNPMPAGQSLSRWLTVGLAGTVRPAGLSGGSRAVPEPASLAMLAAGGLLVGASVRRKN